MRDYQESVTTGQTDRRMDRQTPDKVIPMWRYASQAIQKRDPEVKIFYSDRYFYTSQEISHNACRC